MKNARVAVTLILVLLVSCSTTFAKRKRKPKPTPTPSPPAEAFAGFGLGAIKADTTRNQAYFVDQSGLRILALDTQTGQVSASSALEETPQQAANPNYFPSGELAVAIDGSKLYVALPPAQKIQVFSLPDLVPLITLLMDFSPWSVCATAGDRLYASGDTNPDGSTFGPIREVSISDGSVLQSFGDYHEKTLLRTNGAGTRLYASETEETVYGGPGYMDEYDITGSAIAFLHAHPFDMDGMLDFAVDEQQGRLYTVNGGIYGIELTDMSTDVYGTVWPFGTPYGSSIAFLPTDTAIYGASYESIRKFARADGSVLADWTITDAGTPIRPAALVITPNGVLAYIRKAQFTSPYPSYLGVIGLRSVTLSNSPSNGGPANPTLTAVNFSDSTGTNDGKPNAGEIISFSPTLTNNGTQLAATVSMTVAVDSNATLLSSATQSYGDMPAGTSASFSPFQIQLSPLLQKGSTAVVTFTASWNSGQTKSFPYTIVIQ